MNISKKIVLTVAILPILAVLGYLVLTLTVTNKKDAEIMLTISGAGLNFTGASGHVGTCKNQNSPNCVNVPPGDTAALSFILGGQPGWKFSQMQLVAGPPDINQSAKLNFGNQSGFSQLMRNDFYVTINGANIQPDARGIIKLDTPPGVGRNFILVDKNKLKQTYIYQLQVCKTENDETQCEDSDPRLENEG